LLIIIIKNEVESIRLRTAEYELIVAQYGNFTVGVTQLPTKSDSKVAVVEEKKEGEVEKKESS
jgi:hypothetical protein